MNAVGLFPPGVPSGRVCQSNVSLSGLLRCFGRQRALNGNVTIAG